MKTRLLVSIFLVLTSPLHADDAEAFALLKKPGHFALMRHALAPGVGDPNNFSLKDCRTQRNLSEKGREQAKKIGDQFRKHGIETAAVYTSQWCRCKDTATLMALGKVNGLPLLNSFFLERDREEKQMAALRTWMQARKNASPAILVTHQVVVTSLTDVFPDSGEIVVIEVSESDGQVSIDVRARVEAP